MEIQFNFEINGPQKQAAEEARQQLEKLVGDLMCPQHGDQPIRVVINSMDDGGIDYSFEGLCCEEMKYRIESALRS